jgi:FkbM family methyltransferase
MAIKNSVKRLINSALKNHEIVSKISLDLSQYVDEPSNIIDVGVYRGTDFLLEAYPNSYYHLVEPNMQTHDYINEVLLDQYKGELYKCAAGEKKGELYLSSEEDESRLNNNLGNKVSVERLDDIISLPLDNNTILKIDVEGHELDVLRGSNILLESCKMVILELRLRGRKKVSEPDKIIKFLSERGLKFVDIMGEGRRNDGLNFIDAVFIR